MSYFTTIEAIVKIDDDGQCVWRFDGKQIDELLDDIKRMENLLTDLVQPEKENEQPAAS